MMSTSAKKQVIHVGRAQSWIGHLDNDAVNVANIALLGGDDNTPVIIPASVMMAVVCPEIKFLLLKEGFLHYCSAPVWISIPSVRRSSIELARELMCRGMVEQTFGEESAKRALKGVRKVMGLLAPDMQIACRIIIRKDEEEDESLESARWVNKGMKVDLTNDVDVPGDVLGEVSDGPRNNDPGEENEGSDDKPVENFDVAITNRTEEYNPNADKNVRVVCDNNYGSSYKKKGKGSLQSIVWKSVKSVQKLRLNQSVMDFGLVRGTNSARELHELVPLKLKRESDDPTTKINCPFCSKQFTTAPSIASHMVTHSPGREDVLCPVCEFSTEYYKLVNHIRSRHLGEKVFICELCQTEFSTMSAKSSHKLKHRRTNTHGQCRKCLKFFKKSLGDRCSRCPKN